MIETYAFLAAFTVQILVISALLPGWLISYARAKAAAQLPGWNKKSIDRFLGLYRAVNIAIAVLGLMLLGWLFNQMQVPDWNVMLVIRRHASYLFLQLLPHLIFAGLSIWVKREAITRAPPEARRTATLERRGLFDIVSPFAVLLAVLAHSLFAAFVISMWQKLVPGHLGYRLIGFVTFSFALNAFGVYWLLYRRKRWPLETRAYRKQAVDTSLRYGIYGSIAGIGFISLIVTLRLLDLMRWAPFVHSASSVFMMLHASMQLLAMRRQAEADRLDPNPAS